MAMQQVVNQEETGLVTVTLEVSNSFVRVNGHYVTVTKPENKLILHQKRGTFQCFWDLLQYFFKFLEIVLTCDVRSSDIKTLSKGIFKPNLASIEISTYHKFSMRLCYRSYHLQRLALQGNLKKVAFSIVHPVYFWFLHAYFHRKSCT